MNTAGGTVPRVGCVHRASASNPVTARALQIDPRLISQTQLAQSERRPEVGFQFLPQPGAIGHALAEMPPGLATGFLGLMPGEVGMFQQQRGRRAVCRRARDADADADRRDLAANHIRPAQKIHQPGREIVGRLAVVLQDRERIAIQPGDLVALAGRLTHASHHRTQQRIAAFAAQAIVDRTEAVDVEHQDGRVSFRYRPRSAPRSASFRYGG